MKSLFDILDKYFMPMAKGESKQEKYMSAYSSLLGVLNAVDELKKNGSINDISDLDILFNEARIEEFGYIYVIENGIGCATLNFDNAYDVAQFLLDNDIISKESFSSVVSDIEDIEVGYYGINFCSNIGIFHVSKKQNW